MKLTKLMDMTKQVREYSLTTILRILDSILSTGFSESEPVSILDMGSVTVSETDTVTVSTEFEQICLKTGVSEIKILGTKHQVSDLVSGIASQPICDKTALVAGRHRLIALAIASVIRLDKGRTLPYYGVKVDGLDESIRENIRKLAMSKLSTIDSLRYTIAQGGLSETALAKLGYARGMQQMLHAKAQLVLSFGLDIGNAHTLTREGSQKLLKALKAESNKELHADIVRVGTTVKTKMLSKKDIGELADKCNHRPVKALLQAILTGNGISAMLAVEGFDKA